MPVPGLGFGPGLSFEQQKDLLALCMKLETGKELSLEKIKKETELVKLELQKQKLQLVREGRAMSDDLTDSSFVSEGNQVNSATVNDLRDLKLVPKLNERHPEMFFLMFECLADAWGWSEATCTLLLQCVITSRTQEAQ